jgi:hypothetical protein
MKVGEAIRENMRTHLAELRSKEGVREQQRAMMNSFL